MDTAPQTFSDALAQLDIFVLLGVDGSPAEKQALLDEFEAAVWQDVVDTEVMPQLSEGDRQAAERILDDETTDPDAKPDILFNWVRQYLPDPEATVRQHGLALKAEFLQQRLSGMKEYFDQQPEKLNQLIQAEMLIGEGREDQTVMIMNTLNAPPTVAG